MPSSDAVTTTSDFSDIVACFQSPVQSSDPDIASTPVTKKQKTSGTSIKSVKTVDPAVITQRSDAVIKRILVLESKLLKDRALLAKYIVPYPNAEKSAVEETDENGDDSSSNDK